MTATPSENGFRHLIVGLEAEVPLLNGNHRTYVNLDNAASTPPFKRVRQTVEEFLPYYSSVHRGTGFKSQVSTHAYDQAHRIVLDFFGADPTEYTCIFTKNTTEAINKLARRFLFTNGRDVVLTSGMEHHSNDLPWRPVTHTVHVGLTPDGRLDEAEFDARLAEYRDRIALVAITGASNVTGFINPIHTLAEKVHAAGGCLIVDCAQLAPHRQINMRPLDDPSHLDFIAISAHKMYAPYGTGALIGRRDILSEGDPDQVGGGTIEIVTLDHVVWAGLPDREEAGSPNTVGAIALAAAICQLQEIGMDTIADHEASLTAYALERLPHVPDIHLFGDTNPANAIQRLGVIPMLMEHTQHFLAAAILGYEFGIGVRSGCFCAHPYILHLLQISQEEAQHVRQRILARDKTEMPGMIRASFGLYNTYDEVDWLVEALSRIARGEYQGHYIQEQASGEYFPQGWKSDFQSYFAIR